MTVLTSLLDSMRHTAQKLLEEIFIPVDHFQPNYLGVLSQCVESFLVFLVGMDVGIEEVSGDLLPFFPHLLKRIDYAVGTTDVEEDFHCWKL
jgi:hypothetical protein